jgi:conjugative transposon protein TcpC
MVRRSTVERSPHSVEHDLGYEAETEYAQPDAIGRSRTTRTWRGAGGRWLIWFFRAIAWLVLLVIGYRGVLAIVTGETQSGAPATPTTSGSPSSSFPVTQADAYALQFGQVYLNWSPADATQRASALSTFLPSGSDPQLGWNGTGTSQLQSAVVASTDVRDAHHAVVTLLARVNGQLMQLGVPIYASSGQLVVSGAPAWLPAPARASMPTATPPSTDSALQATLMNQLPAFFQAYGSGNSVTLGRFLASGSSVTGLNGAVTYHSIASLTVPTGGNTRHIIATVIWSVPERGANGQVTKAPPAQLQMSYAMTVVQNNGTWYVSDISTSTAPPESP